MLNKKAVILTIDALLALIAAMTIIVAVVYFTGQVSNIPYNKQALNKISQDSLTVLEKDNVLKTAIETSSNTTLTLFLDSLPSQICAKVDLKSSDQIIQESAIKTNCGSSNETVVVRRSFVANSFNVYYARMEAWHTE